MTFEAVHTASQKQTQSISITPPEKLSAEHWEKLKQELILPLLGEQFP